MRPHSSIYLSLQPGICFVSAQSFGGDSISRTLRGLRWLQVLASRALEHARSNTPPQSPSASPVLLQGIAGDVDVEQGAVDLVAEVCIFCA